MTISPGLTPLAEVGRFRDLSGSRISLTAISRDGLAEMFEYSRDPALYEHLEFPVHRTIEETAAYLEKLGQRAATGHAHYWFIRLGSAGKVIGSFGVHSVDWRKRSCEIGYAIGPSYWGQGYFREALSLVLDLLFSELMMHRVVAVTVAQNESSIRALERSGFRCEGIMRDYYLTHTGTRLDGAIYAILQAEHQPERTE